MVKFLYRVFVYGLLLTSFVNPAIAAFDSASEVKITAADGATYDELGVSVSIDGTRMAVGADYADIDGNNNQGAVYIYDFDGSTWSQTAKITASDGVADDRFGVSVTLSGDRLAVGAYRADIVGNSNQGAAYVFDFSGGSWSETAKLVASDGAAGDYFGYPLSLSETRLAVGSYGDDSGQGSAYVFDLSAGSWTQTTKLVASDGVAGDYFGYPVSLDGNRLAVGAYGDDSTQGSIYIFDLSNTWRETQKITASDGSANDAFGYSISLAGNRLAVGAWADNNDQGSIYVFDLNGTWAETQKLTASDGVAGDAFGYSVSLSGNQLAVGADWNNSKQGAAYVFTLSDGTWGETTKLTATDGAAYDWFGWSVSLSDNHLAVGAYQADVGGNSDQGAVYLYADDVIFKNGFEGD